MTEQERILYRVLESSITQLETILDELKPYWEKSKDVEERLEYRKRMVLLFDLKKQLKELKK
jgi:hypothetical protein